MTEQEALAEQLRTWNEERAVGLSDDHLRTGLACVNTIVNGVQLINGWHVKGLGRANTRQLFLLSLNVACFTWLDDRFDTGVARLEDSMLRDDLLAGPAETTNTPEIRGLRALHATMAGAAQNPEDDALWQRTALESLRAFQRGQRLARHQERWSYAEHLYNAEGNVVVAHFLAAISLLYGLDMPRRLHDPHFQRFLRHLSLIARLENDLYTLAHDQTESCHTNTVLMLADFMPANRAVAFVEADLAYYRQALAEDGSRQGVQDCLSQAGLAIVASYAWCYQHLPRYHGHAFVALGEL